MTRAFCFSGNMRSFTPSCPSYITSLGCVSSNIRIGTLQAPLMMVASRALTTPTTAVTVITMDITLVWRMARRVLGRLARPPSTLVGGTARRWGVAPVRRSGRDAMPPELRTTYAHA